MPPSEIVDALESIALGSVALTNEALQRAGTGPLTFPQWRAVVVVGAHAEGVRLGALSRQVGVTLPATSRLVHRLADRGLIRIEPDPGDARARLASLTQSGRTRFRRVLAYRRKRLAAVAETVRVPASSVGTVVSLGVAFRKLG